ncbi:hypothetical protein EHS13_10880 [Paenibacillus psychroresistens]|uniref:Uncharacterized protein n=1 Tax=Paenibacillus psychroresistens TaxID=1778678 RepID=A0A6B8RFW3_9BACL|nr:hypothetical protein [Paenibacillus psychroresistens]QGQ95351.1 hypothetical protein EHS13_10880 [Paenibacillus psychroresistens]
MEINITNQSKDNVVLLPKTIDFYQIEITRMLETERYEEAITLLRFLGKCDSGDPRTNEEWLSLLDWLESMSLSEAQDDELDEEPEETEKDLLRQHLQLKTEQDPNYINELIEMLQPHIAAGKQILALDQLAYMEEAASAKTSITQALISWLEANTISPWIQFKALQVLKIRSFQGEIQISKGGIPITLDISEVPLELEGYPEKIGMVLSRLQKVAEMDEPSLSYFAEEIWEQFLAYIYATPAYEQLVHGDEQSIGVWASALHSLIGELMTGTFRELEIQRLYEIPEESQLLWKRAFQTLNNFAAQFPITLK